MSYEIREPAFKLISCTQYPLQTLFAVWVTSRPSQFKEFLDWHEKRYGHRLPTGETVDRALQKAKYDGTSDRVLDIGEVEKVFLQVVAMSIPVSECIHFTWGFTNLPIAWREQAVRKRQWGFWLTSAREFDNSTFVEDGRVEIPARLFAHGIDEGSGEHLASAYDVLMDVYSRIESGYQQLRELGLTEEEARVILPMGMKNNGTMFANYRTLMDTVKARVCWIAQVDLWGPVVKGIANSLREIHPLLDAFVTPPCFKPKSNKFEGCPYEGININRVEGKDPYAPCPLYMQYKAGLGPHGYDAVLLEMEQKHRRSHAALARTHLPVWKEIWKRDPHTGEVL